MATMPDITISFEPKALAAIETLAAATAAIKVNADAISSMREVEERMRSAEAERDAALADLALARAELKHIATANPTEWDSDVRDQFQSWAQNRARAALERRK